MILSKLRPVRVFEKSRKTVGFYDPAQVEQPASIRMIVYWQSKTMIVVFIVFFKNGLVENAG